MAMRVSREEFLGIPTKEERREVAQKLREYASWKGAECLVCCEDWGEMVLNLFIGKCGESYRDNYEYLADLIDPLPETIDGKEVVRCKDCVHYSDGMVVECERLSGQPYWTDPNGYCAWGRKEQHAD